MEYNRNEIHDLRQASRKKKIQTVSRFIAVDWSNSLVWCIIRIAALI